VALREVYFNPGTSADAGGRQRSRPGQLAGWSGRAGLQYHHQLPDPRLYDVTGGSVQIDGIDVRHARQHRWLPPSAS
jgi:hypothetical protein